MISNSLPAVGFIGLGDQGMPMAIAIAEFGYPLHVWARRPETLTALDGVPHTRHDGPADLAAATDIICLCVRTDEDVLALLTGELLATVRPGSIVVNHGTGTPGNAVTFGEICTAAGVGFLDAPVSGGHAGAVARTLTTMIGGPEQTVLTCEPVFHTFSSHVVHLGGHGAGELAKLLNNTLLMMNHASIADILELATRLGIDPVALVAVIKTGSGASAALELLPAGTTAPPTEMVEHGRDILLLDMKLFDTAMHTVGIDAEEISARAVSGALRFADNIRILNP